MIRTHFDKFVVEMRAGDEIYLYDNSEDQSTKELVVTPKLLRHCVGANDVDRTAQHEVTNIITEKIFVGTFDLDESRTTW